MTHKFASKEIHFLKIDSDDVNVRPPKTFFCDLLLAQSIPLKTFEKRLSDIKTPDRKFLCVVVQISSDTPEEVKEKAKGTFEATFNLLLDKKRGLWESLDELSFILAFWDYENDEKASQLIVSLKEKICASLKADILIGVAKFPFHDFSEKQTIANSLKAIDHAAFFGPDTLIHFDATSLNISGDRFYQLNKYKIAIKDYQKGLKIKPRDINLTNSLGVCFGVMGKLDKAKLEFEKAVKIDPNEVMVIYNIGLLHRINKDIDKAVVYLRKAHGIDDHVFEVELLLGHLLFQKRKLKQALPHLETASRIHPNSSIAFRLKGEIYLKNNCPEKAAPEFNRAIKINPSDAVSLSGYANSLERQNKNLKIALSFAKSSIALEPDNKLYQDRLNTIQEKIEANPHTNETIKTA